ncbi:chloride channel protein [Clostridium tarantellae]|uniref:Voltage-gated chloride channel protein n=1 Tax=Clostridium tarantellae TaxID=39493 RepID=A0A6I1MV39_9CLOT|nr:chloride channel protein [Clostridium tarantellae]MPQ44711.1 voltage-gated chloride channel protein [Clostridium tarantellae]
MKRKIILKLGLCASIIGIITGLIIALFLIGLEKATYFNQNYKWLIFILPFSGAIMTYAYEKYGKNSHKGNNIIIENINGSNEKIHFIMAPLVFIGTILAHLFGASVGREGTGVQIGGTIGSVISDKIKLHGVQKRILLISGVSAGFSSVFGTPLAGTLFALEVARIGNLTYEAFLPAIIAALVGDWVVKYIGVTHTHFIIPPSESFILSTVIKVIIMAICFGIVSKLFSLFTHWFKEILSKYLKKSYMKTIVGGLLMVIITLLIGNRLYNGLSLGLLSDAFNGNVSYYSFFIKLVLTTLCLGAGYQGGEVTPLFVIGSTLGCILGGFMGLPFAFSASLGLVAVFAGATKTPIASFMMGLELFGSNNMIFIMLVCVISVFISGKKGIYGAQIWGDL